MIERREVTPNNLKAQIFLLVNEYNLRKLGEQENIELRELMLIPRMSIIQDELGRNFRVEAVHGNGSAVVKRLLKFKFEGGKEVWHGNTKVRLPLSKDGGEI